VWARSRVADRTQELALPRPRVQPPILPEKLAEFRRRGAAGGVIAPHRAFLRVALSGTEKTIAGVFPVFLSALWLGAHVWITRLWSFILEYGRVSLGLDGRTVVAMYDWGAWLHIGIPFLAVPAPAPTREIWVIGAAATVVLFVGSFFLAERLTPVAYGIRALSLVQLSAQAFFAFASGRFPYGLADYTLSGMAAGYTMIAALPLLFGLIYFIFEFRFYAKVMLTVTAMVHLTLLLPLQYLMHSYLIARLSLLVMPVLFIFFGLSLEVMVFIALYSWGMSWKGIVPEDQPARNEP
jgi:hypothetical protein